VVGELIRLKFAIQRHTLSWKRVLGLVLGVVGALATWVAVLVAAPSARSDVLLFMLAAWLVGWLVGPILTSGAAVLRPEYFTLLPLSPRRLGVGLLASVFVGVGAAVTAAAVLALVGYAVVTAVPDIASVAAAVGIAVVGAALLLVFTVALSRVAYALLGAAMRTRMGVEIAAIQYGLLLASMFVGWVIVSPVVSALPVFLRDGFGASGVSGVLALFPSSWPLLAVDAVAAGDLASAMGLIGALALVTALVVLAAVALLTPYVGNRTVRRRTRPWGSRVLTRGRLLPGTPLGAVVGKELRTWWRDPWRSLEVRSSIWFGIFVAIYGVIAGIPQLAGLAGIAVALMVGLSGANLFGQDGTALWLLMVGQSPRAVRADIRGRQIGLVVALGVPAFGLSTLMMALTGVFEFAVPIYAAILATLGVGSAVAVVMSVVGVTPGVDPHRRVNATDAGENGFAIQVALWAVLLLIAPTVAVAVSLAFGADPPLWLAVVTLAVALGNAVAAGWAGGAVAVRRLESHLPETFARLRYPGTTMAKGRGGGFLDYLSGHAESAALAAAAAAKGEKPAERTKETIG
jgi:ABC-2 type transport system permease protein